MPTISIMFKLKFKAYCMPHEISTVKNIAIILLLVVDTINKRKQYTNIILPM